MVYHKRTGRGGQAPILKYLFGLQKEACKEQGIKFDDNDPWEQEDIIIKGDSYLQWLNSILVFVFGQRHFPAAFDVTSQDIDLTIQADGDGNVYFIDACKYILDDQYQNCNGVVVNKKQNLLMYFDNKAVAILTKNKNVNIEDLKSVDLDNIDFETCGEYFKFALNKNGITKFDKIFDDPSTEIYLSDRDY